MAANDDDNDCDEEGDYESRQNNSVECVYTLLVNFHHCRCRCRRSLCRRQQQNWTQSPISMINSIIRMHISSISKSLQ